MRAEEQRGRKWQIRGGGWGGEGAGEEGKEGKGKPRKKGSCGGRRVRRRSQGRRGSQGEG